MEGPDAGADDYLVKPFSSRELLARVGANLALSKLRRAALSESSARTAELEALIDAVPVAVWFTHDREARSAWSNAFAAKMMGLTLDRNPSRSAPVAEAPDPFQSLPRR
ncbi:hypothetical protein [Phenylobacterium sp. J426]|uniref:hypothetical protein n=1 Tax=Phenylobacterium sp. J426 TaxID=2898439 RepID=UPI0035B35421